MCCRTATPNTTPSLTPVPYDILPHLRLCHYVRCTPDVQVFTLLMSAHIRVGQWREAMALFDDMTARHGVSMRGDEGFRV